MVPFIFIKLIDLILVALHAYLMEANVILAHLRRSLHRDRGHDRLLRLRLRLRRDGVAQLLFRHQADGSITANGST